MLGVYLITILALALWFFKSSFSFWRNRGVPQNSQWNPLGDMWDVGLRTHITYKMDSMYKKFKSRGPLFGFYALLSPMAVVTDLDLLRSILVKDFGNFVERGVFCNEEADPLSGHLFLIGGEKWRKLRNALSPVFTSGKMKGMYHIIEDKTQELMQYFERNADMGGIDVKQASTRFTADVVSSTAFGLESRALVDEKPVILDVLKKVFEDSALFFIFLTTFPKLSMYLKLRLTPREVEEFCTETIQNTIEYRKKNGVKRADFLNMLINLRERGTISDTDPENPQGKLTFNQVLAQAFLFFAAGFETSSTVMSLGMYFLAKHPEIQTRLRREIQQVRARHDGKVPYEALMEMTYLNQVFNETMRIFPAVDSLIRKTHADYPVPNSSIVIPKGTMIQVPVYSIHRDPEYFPNPDKFDPERFTPEEVAKRHPYAFLPFGDGPRNCIGMRFAQLQSKYALAATVENFELTVNSRTREPIRLDKSNPNTHIDGGLWVNFRKL